MDIYSWMWLLKLCLGSHIPAAPSTPNPVPRNVCLADLPWRTSIDGDRPERSPTCSSTQLRWLPQAALNPLLPRCYKPSTVCPLLSTHAKTSLLLLQLAFVAGSTKEYERAGTSSQKQHTWASAPSSQCPSPLLWEHWRRSKGFVAQRKSLLSYCPVQGLASLQLTK